MSIDNSVPLELSLISVRAGEKSRNELQQMLGLKHEGHFRASYLLPVLERGLLEMTRLETPKDRLQRYRLTQKGKHFNQNLWDRNLPLDTTSIISEQFKFAR